MNAVQKFVGELARHGSSLKLEGAFCSLAFRFTGSSLIS